MASTERTIEVEQDSASETTDDDSQSSESEEDEEVIATYPATVPIQLACPPLVQYPYQYVHPNRSQTRHGRHERKRGKENHGERRHNTEHGHGRHRARGHDHSDAQGEDRTEGRRHGGEGRHRQSEGHHQGSKGHHHGSKGHHRDKGHHHDRDGHRSRQEGHGGRHGRRHRSSSSDERSDLIFRCADVQCFKQEEVKVTVSDGSVKVKAVNADGEITRVFKVTKDYDISKMRVSRSRSGVITVIVPAKDSGEDVKQDTSKN